MARLDDLAASLARDGQVAAVLGLGSAGAADDRFDDHSDIDFFVVVDDPMAKSPYLVDIDWLEPMGRVVYDFVNDPNGRKALFDDGLFIEYAIFTAAELRAFPLTGVRIVWRRPDAESDLVHDLPIPAVTAIDTVDFHLNEALTNLFVGLHRELRGERLTASRFIQVFAVDRILALVRLTGLGRPSDTDPFEPTRRVETGCPLLVEPLRQMLPGYDHNARAARAVLDWLGDHFRPDPVISSRIAGLIEQADHRRRACDLDRNR